MPHGFLPVLLYISWHHCRYTCPGVIGLCKLEAEQKKLEAKGITRVMQADEIRQQQQQQRMQGEGEENKEVKMSKKKGKKKTKKKTHDSDQDPGATGSRGVEEL
jgi:hypothetical protein